MYLHTEYKAYINLDFVMQPSVCSDNCEQCSR